MAEPEDEDDFPNDYDGLDFDNIPELQAPTIRTPEVSVPSVDLRNIVPSAAASPVPSTGSDSIEEMDSSFLAAVDALEAHALGEVPQGKEHRRLEALRSCYHADLGSGLLSRAEPGLFPVYHVVPMHY